MSKPVLNNQILFNSYYGFVEHLGQLVTQPVTPTSSPTFANLYISGDTIISGNLDVLGNITVIDTDITEFKDNIILINRGETTHGVMLNESGIEIDRGLEENYRIVFSETKGTALMGFLSDMLPIATREYSPLNNGIMIWNQSIHSLDSRNYIDLPTVYFNSTIQSINYSTGSIVMDGGLTSKKNINAMTFTLNGTSSTLATDNTGSLLLGPTGKLKFLHSTDSINGITINRESRDLKINIPQLSDYGSGLSPKFSITTNSGGTNLMSISESQSIFDIDIYSNQLLVVNNTTIATTPTNASTIIYGGLGVAKNLIVKQASSFLSTVDLSNNKILNLAMPTSSGDGANKAYVDLIKQGLYVKDSVLAATITHGTLSTAYISGSLVDGVTLTNGSRILIKDQINGIENGIYIVGTSGSPLRSEDLTVGSSASGIFCFVKQGNINNNLGFVCNNDIGSDIVGTNSLGFTEFTGLGLVDAGSGLSKSFNTLNVNTDNFSINVNGLDELQIPNSFAGVGLTGGNGTAMQVISDQSQITKIGNIISGSWASTVIDVPYGGSGRSLFTFGKLLIGNSSSGILSFNTLSYDNTNSNLNIGGGISTIGNINLNFSQISSYNDGTSNTLKVFSNYPNTNGNILLNSTFQISSIGNINLTGDFNSYEYNTFYKTTSSLNYSTASTVFYGGVSIRESTNSSGYSAGGALTISGGTTIGGDLYVKSSIYCTTANLQTLNVNGTNGINLCNGTLTISSSVPNSIVANGDVYLNSSLYIGITNANFTQFTMTQGNCFQYVGPYTLTYNDTHKNFYINNSYGNIGLGSTGNILIGTTTGTTLLSIKSNNLITGDSTVSNKWLGIASNDISSSSKIVLYNNGDVNIWTGTTLGTFALKNSLNNFITTDNFGGTTFHQTTSSTNSSTGSVVFNGGVSVKCSTNAISYTQGGSATFAGGGAFEKDLYIGGNLHLSGSLVSPASLSYPTISYGSESNCSVVSFSNSKLINLYGELMLSFNVEIAPTTANTICRVNFGLPSIASTLISRNELIATSQGYTDDSNLTSIFNILCVGETGTTNGILKFQSNSLGVHYFQVFCKYY